MKTDRRGYTKSSSFFMAMLFTILCGLVAITLGYFINYFAKGHFVDSTEIIVESEIRYLQAVGLDQAIDKASPNELYILLDEKGKLPKEFPPLQTKLAEGLIVFEYPKTKQKYAARIETLNDHQKVLVGTNITEISNDFYFMKVIGVLSIVFIIFVVFVSYIISIFVVSGTNDIVATAREIIKTGDLSRRVEIKSDWDDLSNVASILNLLLDRVQQLMSGIREVSDNIAHDLRTPLTRLRNHIDDLNNDTHKDKLLKEADHVLETFNALLRISNIENAKQKGQFNTINLSNLIDDAIELYEPLAEEKQISIHHKIEEAEIFGDRNLLFQAYANLLDNAIKFTPKNGKIDIALYHQNNHIYVEVSDTGTGVKTSETKRIFDRFYRGEKSRNSAGSGLGLSMVAAVIALHDGIITATNNNPGLKIITKF